MQETWSLHVWLSSVGKGIKEEEVQRWRFWWLKEEEEIFKVLFIKTFKVLISQEEQLQKDRAFIGKEMDSEAESEENVEEEESEESYFGVAT